MTDINYLSILPTLTVYEDRLNGTDRTAYTVYGVDEAFIFARVLVNNGSAVEIYPSGSFVPSPEELEELEKDFGDNEEGSTEGFKCRCGDPACPCYTSENAEDKSDGYERPEDRHQGFSDPLG